MNPWPVRPLGYVLLAALALMVATPPGLAQVLFQEDFQSFVDPKRGTTRLRCEGSGGAGTWPFPTGWLLRNVDDRRPSAQVAEVNDAGEVREDCALDLLNCVAFRTSCTSPRGAADDWMWTPLIGPLPPSSRLDWRARA